MDAGLDTGDMLMAHTLPIMESDTTATLHDRLAVLGGRLMVLALQQVQQGELKPVPQPAEGVSYAHKIEKHEAAIDWTLAADLIVRRVRAFNPFPGASATLGGEPLKVWMAAVQPGVPPTGAKFGEILAVAHTGIAVAAMNSIVNITLLQRAGGKRLDVADFLRGADVQPGMVLGGR
jgi:methionyl-tRNA formyltransferase